MPDGTAGRTYLVVRVPEADPAVRSIDGDDALPAHVTALGPFMPLDAINVDVAGTIASVTLDAMLPITTRVVTLELWSIHADGIEVVRRWRDPQAAD